jgi:hypothetical protein
LIFDLLFLLSIITWNSFRRMKRKTMRRDPITVGHLSQHVIYRDRIVQVKVQVHAKRLPVVLLKDSCNDCQGLSTAKAPILSKS